MEVDNEISERRTYSPILNNQFKIFPLNYCITDDDQITKRNRGKRVVFNIILLLNAI